MKYLLFKLREEMGYCEIIEEERDGKTDEEIVDFVLSKSTLVNKKDLELKIVDAEYIVNMFNSDVQ